MITLLLCCLAAGMSLRNHEIIPLYQERSRGDHCPSTRCNCCASIGRSEESRIGLSFTLFPTSRQPRAQAGHIGLPVTWSGVNVKLDRWIEEKASLCKYVDIWQNLDNDVMAIVSKQILQNCNKLANVLVYVWNRSFVWLPKSWVSFRSTLARSPCEF